MNKCVICWHNDDKIVAAAAICNELQKPVCEKHAAHCEDEGHGTLPLPQYLERVRPGSNLNRGRPSKTLLRKINKL